jgi:hypothetical protein
MSETCYKLLNKIFMTLGKFAGSMRWVAYYSMRYNLYTQTITHPPRYRNAKHKLELNWGFHLVGCELSLLQHPHKNLGNENKTFMPFSISMFSFSNGKLLHDNRYFLCQFALRIPLSPALRLVFTITIYIRQGFRSAMSGSRKMCRKKEKKDKRVTFKRKVVACLFDWGFHCRFSFCSFIWKFSCNFWFLKMNENVIACSSEEKTRMDVKLNYVSV